MNFLKYLYVRFYQLMVSVGNADIAGFAAILFMTLMFGINTLSFFSMLALLGVNTFKEISTLYSLIYIAFIFILLYTLLFHKDKSSKIVDSYSHETKGSRIKGIIGVLIYCILSIAVLVVLFIVKSKHNLILQNVTF